ncbi:MAG: TIGR00295 family protein [Archaeoglobaceae archaeon]|nr:TIGR00295 family protein [Archaeoglobaceae archaeon]
MEMLEEVKKLWDKYKLSEDVRKHCMKVAEVALKIANSIESDVGIDKNAVLIGALLHDIGRAVTNDPFLHFIKSAEILRKEGFDDKIVKIAERHFSAGLSKEDAKKLGLPIKNYMPKSLEEKIVSFADNLVFGDKEGKFEDFMKRLDEIDKRNGKFKWLTEKTRKRALKIKEELEKLSGLKF